MDLPITIDNLCNEFTTKNIITKKEETEIINKENIEINIDNLCNEFTTKNIVTKKEETEIIEQVNLEIEREREIEIKPKKKEVQAHGFTWEKELLINVYKATTNELKEIKYNSKMDLPAKLNRLDSCNISVKTSGKKNAVCMSDCLRIFDSVSSDNPIHMVVVHYNQDDINNIKKVVSIIEIDLTLSQKLLFGELIRSQLEELDKVVKLVPQKRKPTIEEYNNMYSIRNKLQELSNAIHLDIKCDSSQSRLQCSFNSFNKFIENNPSRVIAKSNTNEFRGGNIPLEIKSSRRVFKPKIILIKNN